MIDLTAQEQNNISELQIVARALYNLLPQTRLALAKYNVNSPKITNENVAAIQTFANAGITADVIESSAGVIARVKGVYDNMSDDEKKAFAFFL